MGKKQHQQDKLYITSTEWREEWGGKKRSAEIGARAKFRRLPFSCCSLSLQPFEAPYCTKEGAIFDLLSIIPFLKKHGVNPLTGESMTAKDLTKLNFSKNADGKYHCPVLFKVFNENSHIVAIKTTGNVFSYEAVEQLNINPKHWKDLLTDEPFTRGDIIHIQDPTNLEKFNMADFFYVKKGLNNKKEAAEERQQKAQIHLKNLNPEATETLKALQRDYKNPTEEADIADLYAKPGTSSSVSTASGKYNAALYSTGRAAASFTCTVAERVTHVEAAVLDDDTLRYKYLPKGKKGYVRVVTNLGNLNLELHCDLVPHTCDNFIRHCKSGYYKGCRFFRVVRNFIAQTGDPTNTGDGGESAFKDGACFDDEFVPQLLHTTRGVVSMANNGKNNNKSQFFITFAESKFLDRRHTIFGRVVGGMDTLVRIERVEVNEGDGPLKPITIEDIVVFVDPFVEADEAVRKAKEEEEQRSKAKPLVPTKQASKKSADTLASATSSGVGKYINMSQPEQIHLALGTTEEQMVVTWVTANATKKSVVEYGHRIEMNLTAVGSATLFTDSGSAKRKMYIHRVTLQVEPGRAYYYHVGSPLEAWSSVFYFRALPRSTENWSPRLAIYGDLGNVNSRSLAYLQADVQRGKFDAILHVGDFAYDMDTNNAKVGDEFMRMIEPVAGYVPYMVCPGNHENAYNFSNYINRFSMPGGSNSSMFYSFNLGPAHFIGISTEYYYFLNYGWEQVVAQWNWLVNDLKEANRAENRKQRPWIITFGHRPMYCTNNDRDDCTRYQNLIRRGMPFLHICGLEDLFLEYGVDFEIWAHEHAFERLWPVYNTKVYNGTEKPYTNPGAPAHVTTGSAGCQERTDQFVRKPPVWSAFRSSDYGFSTMKIYNKTHINFEQFSVDQDKVVDDMWLVKTTTYPSYYGSLLRRYQLNQLNDLGLGPNEARSPFRAASQEVGLCQLQ